MNRAQFPYDYIPDKDVGRPLFNAELYFGIPDLDPEIPANQIDVYGKQEDGTSVLLPQPIETGAGGVPLYNGSPIELLVDELFYSFKALSRNGSQIYYAENVAAVLTADAIPGILENAVTSVNYLSDLAAISPAFDGQRYSVTNSSSTSDSGYSEYVYRLASTYPADGEFIIDAPSSGQFWRLSGGYDIDVTFTVGTSERFTTLNDALVFASAYKPVAGKVIELRLKTGFVLAEQVLFENTDFRHVLITSADPIVTVARSAITATWRGIIPAFGFAKSFAPIISVQFEMDTSGSDLGQYGIAIRTSVLRSELGAGFRGAPSRNIECAWGSILDIRYGDFSDSGDVGIRVSNGSIAYVRTCKANGCNTGISVSNAWADFTDGEATGCQFSGAAAGGGGILLVNNADCTGNVLSGSLDHADIIAEFSGKVLGTGAFVGGGGNDGVRADGGEISIDLLNCTNAARYAIHSLGGGTVRCPKSVLSGGTLLINNTNSFVDATESSMSPTTSGQLIFSSGGHVESQSSTINASTGSGATSVIAGSDGATINISKSTCNNANLGLFRFLRGSKLIAASVTATGCKMTGASQMGRFDGSELVAPSSNFSGRLGGGAGFDIQLGSSAILTGSDIRNSGGVTTVSDVRVFTSGSAKLNNASVSGQSFAGYNVVKNTLTADGSVIYDN